MSQNRVSLLSSSYFGPIQYYAKFLQYDEVFIEQFENFPKQTYRNRCRILNSNGTLDLSIPVKKTTKPKCLTKNMEIGYETDWQKDHLRALEAAYRHSPFYEFYIDDLKYVFKTNETNLLKLNDRILQTMLELLNIETSYQYTDGFMMEVPVGIKDYREAIHPKKVTSDETFIAPKYIQVIYEKQKDFVPNLSILDLLFNEGPNAKNMLWQSIASKI